MKKLFKGIIAAATLIYVGQLVAVPGVMEWRFRSGYVMSQGLVYTEGSDPSPIFVEYDEGGNIAGEIGPASGDLEDAYVLSGHAYHSLVEFYNEFIEQNEEGLARGAYILDAESYEAQSFATKDGQAITDDAKGEVSPSSKSVLVKSQDLLLIPENTPMLLQVPIDLNDIRTIDPDAIQSVLLNDNGQVVAMSQNNIGYKVAYFEGDDNKENPDRGDKIYGPIHLAPLEVGGGAFLGGGAVTDDEGFYTALYMLPPCPGFSFEFTTNNVLTLHYVGYNPKASKVRSYHIMKPGYDTCVGYGGAPLGASLSAVMAQLNAQAIVANLAVPNFLQNFKVDTAFVSGKAFFTNEEKAETDGSEEPIPIGSTTYKLEKKEREGVVAQTNYDFDGDDELEIAVLGDWGPVLNDDGETVEGFVKSPDQLSGELQGIFLSSGSKDPESSEFSKNQPDFVRLADYAPDLQDQGLLEFISEDDIKDTDVYVFRESNGKIIARKEEQKDTDFKLRRESGFDYDSGEFYYGMMIRGPDSAPFDLVDKYNRSGPDWYSAWQSEAEVDPTLHSRESDKMRPHEKLLVVAINRKTGYIGTMRTEYGKNYKNGIISPIVPKDKRIVLRPPNLKISAERMYKIEKGFIPSDERDKEHEYLIGHEGAALKSDVWVKVTTEWFDHDGSPLPKDLEEEGYTARLAKIAGENELVAQGGDFAQFSLKPGRHTENIQITGEGSLAEHFYVQVSGEKKDENPDFSTLGAGAGPLQYRPENYVPFKVAIPDETLTWEQFTAYKKLKKQEGNEDLEEPKPIYKWFYRPEMQFSLFDLKVKDILRETRDENGTDISVTVYNNKAPIISSSDDLTKVLYNLLEQTIEPLQFLGNKQQLVFALGEEELAAELGQDKQLKFINLEHLTKLDIEDYLSLRLYNNHDPGNILWQYAFAQLVLFPLPSEEVPFTRLSADDVERIYHSATIVNELEEPIEVRWEYESDEGVTFDPPSQKNADGLYTTHATLPTTADTEVEIYAVQTENPTARILSSKYRIAPGKPAVLEVEQSGKMAIDEIGEVTLTVTAKDDFDNLVEDGTAVQVQSDNLVITGNAQTVDGKATFTLRGGFDVGQQDVTVQVGELVETVSVDVLDVDIQISIPAEVEVGANMPIYVQATSAYGDLSGVPIMIKGTRVALDKHIYTLGSGNIVDISGFVGNYVGEGNIMVAIGDKFERSDFKVIDTSGVTVLDNVVVSGVQGKSSFTVNGAIYEYTGETAVVVSGNEGDEYTASLVDYLDPPILPELRFTMQNEVKFNQIFDEMLDVPAHVTSVDRTYNPFESLKYAMDFDASSLMRIEHLELKDISSPGVVFNLNVSALGSGSIHRIASLDNVGINIDLNESRQVVLSQTDGVNTVSITSPEINLESWIKVGAHLVNGQLVLQVNDEIVKSSDALPIVDNASHLIVIGGGFNGQISQFTAYDWDAEKIITFDDGSLDKTVEIGPTGKGVLKVNVGAVNLFAEHQTRKYQRLYKKFGDSYFEVAFALGNDCTPIDMSAIDSFDTALNTGAAMAGFLADCEILPKIKEAFITIKSDSSAWRKAIAVADFATYTAVYISAKTTELALILGPECAEGAITGNVTGFASATCDIITSFFLIGDLRDFAIHSWHMYGWGDIKKFNYAVYIFAGLGIASSGASVLGGVGIPANIGFAGCKAAAKLFNSAFIKALAKYFNKEVGGNLTNLSKLGDALKLSLPMIQLVGAAIVLKDVAPKVWDGLKEIKAEQIVGMMRYFRTMLEKLQDDINTVSVLDKNEFNLLVEAYALNADALLNLLGRTAKETSAIKTAINRIQRTFDYPPEYVRGGDTKFKELFNEGLSKFGGKIDDLSDNELAKIVAEDKFMLALVLVQDMAKNTSKSGQDMVDAIRRMPCNPGPRGCINSGASKDEMVEFFANFEKLADAKVAGRIDDVAWSSLSRVITDMGQKVGQNTDNAAVRRVNSAKGASANLAEITAQVSEKGAKLVKAEEPIPTNLNVGVHKADHIIEVDGKTLNREVKNWEPDVIAKSLAGSLKGSKKVDGKLEPAGQLHKNFVDIFNKGLHKKVEDINYEWVFTKGELSKIKKDLVRQITNNDANLKAAMIASQNPSLVKMARGNTKADIDALEDFKKTILPQIVNKIIVKSL